MRRSKDRYGADVGEAGSGEPGEGRALRARFSDVDLIHELPYGPAACEPPQQRPDTWQYPIQRSSCPKILLAPEGASTHALRALGGPQHGGWLRPWRTENRAKRKPCGPSDHPRHGTHGTRRFPVRGWQERRISDSSETG